MRTALLGTTAFALLLGSAGFAQAQTTPPPADGGTAVQEVIVTASRREETVQKSSLAISVVGAQALQQAGVSKATDLQNVVPGLTVSEAGTSVNAFVRGVGSFSTDANAESAIAFNINGVYISRPSGIGPIFYDLDRVEVLKGPQGTLYGRNASGGAINLITKRPGHEFGGDASVDIGNYDLYRFTGAVNLPVNDTLAFRAATQIAHRDGYLSDGYDDQKSQAFRLTGLWQPTDKLSVFATGEYTHLGGQGAGVVKRALSSATPSDPWTGPSSPLSQPPSAALGGTRINPDGWQDLKVWAVSAELNYDFGPATLTFIPAYRNTKPSYLTYTPGFYFNTAETSDQQSYELRLSHQTNVIKWVAGLYYFDEDQTQHYDLHAAPFQQGVVDSTLGTKSYAAFGEATVSVTDAFRLIGGLRYSKDDKNQDGQTTSTLPRPGVTSNFGEASFHNTSWKAGAEYDLTSENMLFATVSTGYKSGGFFPSVPAPLNVFKPEKLTAYTVGSRNRFLDNRLQVNLEGFYWDYKNKQERFLAATATGTTGLFTTNAGAATLYGADLDVQFRLTANDSLHGSAEYLHSKYDSFTYTAYSPPPTGLAFGYAPQATGCKLGPITPYTVNDPFVPTDSTQTVDCSGKPLVRAPKWSGSAGYDHTFDLSNGSHLVAGVTVQYASRQYLTADFIASAEDNGYATVDADLAWTAPGDKFSIEGWIRNATNEAIYTGGFRYPFSLPAAAGGDPTTVYANIRPPRTFGVTLGAKF